jgi:hypothetical protein
VGNQTTGDGNLFTLVTNGSGQVTQTTFAIQLQGVSRTVATWTVVGGAIQTALGGLVTGTTQLLTDNSTLLATTAFVQGLIGGLGGAPSAPTGLTATAGNAQVTVAWTNGSGATTNVFRNTSNNVNTALLITNTASASIVDTGLTNGTTYYYWVTSVATGGQQSTVTGPASATPSNLPGGIRATNSATNVVGSTGFSTPAGAVANDVILVFVLELAVPSTPAGWTGRAQDASNASNPLSINLYSKIAGGAETFAYGGSSDLFSAVCVVVEKTAYDHAVASGGSAFGTTITAIGTGTLSTSTDVGVAGFGTDTNAGGSPGTITLPGGLSSLGTVTFSQTVSSTTYQGRLSVGSAQLASSSSWNPGNGSSSTSGYGMDVSSACK